MNATSRLLLASAGPNGVRAMQAEMEQGSIDWDLLIALAVREGAAGVIWRQLRSISTPAVPDSQRIRLARLATISEFRAALLGDRLETTLREFDRARVPVILLKGAALAKTVYASFTDRPMMDLDLLVAPEDMEGAFEAACRAGWVESEGDYPRRRYKGHQHGPPLLDSEGTGVRLELHTDLFVPGHRFGLSRSEILQDARRLESVPGSVFVPSTTHSLLHTCVHFAWSHMMRFGAWRAVRDVSVLTNAGATDWDLIVREAVAHHAASCCYWTFHVAHARGGLDVPSWVEAALRPYRSEYLLGPLSRHLELQLLPSDAFCPSHQLSAVLWSAAIRPRRSGHGAIRPWHAPKEIVTAGVAPSLMKRMAGHARRSVAWRRYLHEVLFARPSAG